MNESTVRALRAAGLDPAEVARVVRTALDEDLGPARLDVTSVATIPDDQVDTADVVARADGVVAGLAVAAAVFEEADARTRWESRAGDGDRVARGAVLATVAGPTRALLTAERTALNLLCHLSGVATLTARFVDAVEGTGTAILDTRKTIPGLRALEKAAVAAGGGLNHRMGLHDAILIKENHVALAGSLAEAVRRARAADPGRGIEVECRSVDEAAYALGTGVQRLLLDNMGIDELRHAVEARDAAAKAHGPVTTLEASGGIALDNVAEVAATGVDFISVGALTHSAPALDLSMLLEPA
jgi:nicotinate-nucleotide pyrophosphorylase (carboxylating)